VFLDFAAKGREDIEKRKKISDVTTLKDPKNLKTLP